MGCNSEDEDRLKNIKSCCLPFGRYIGHVTTSQYIISRPDSSSRSKLVLASRHVEVAEYVERKATKGANALAYAGTVRLPSNSMPVSIEIRFREKRLWTQFTGNIRLRSTVVSMAGGVALLTAPPACSHKILVSS